MELGSERQQELRAAWEVTQRQKAELEERVRQIAAEEARCKREMEEQVQAQEDAGKRLEEELQHEQQRQRDLEAAARSRLSQEQQHGVRTLAGVPERPEPSGGPSAALAARPACGEGSGVGGQWREAAAMSLRVATRGGVSAGGAPRGEKSPWFPGSLVPTRQRAAASLRDAAR